MDSQEYHEYEQYFEHFKINFYHKFICLFIFYYMKKFLKNGMNLNCAFCPFISWAIT